jgi:hypothetical protein
MRSSPTFDAPGEDGAFDIGRSDSEESEQVVLGDNVIGEGFRCGKYEWLVMIWPYE